MIVRYIYIYTYIQYTYIYIHTHTCSKHLYIHVWKSHFFQGLPLLEGGVLSTRFGATFFFGGGVVSWRTMIGSPPSFSRTRYVKDGGVFGKKHIPGIHPKGSWHGRTAGTHQLWGGLVPFVGDFGKYRGSSFNNESGSDKISPWLIV